MNIKYILLSFLNYTYNNIITHIPIRGLRITYLRLFNKKIHPSTIILMHCRLLNFWKLQIEEGVIINQYCLMDCRVNTIYIGKHSDIGPYSKVWTLGHDPNSNTHSTFGGDVIIGHHVWIASSVTILPSVNLGNGTVVASCSVVHKSTSEKDIVAGNPAIFKRKRINDLNYTINYNPYFE